MLEKKVNKLKSKVQKYLVKGETEKALRLFSYYQGLVDNEMERVLISLSIQFKNLESDKRKNIISYEEYSINLNKINDTILYLADQIPFEIIEVKNLDQAKRKSGCLVHSIPNFMPVDIETKCVVRIGNQKEILVENLENIEIENINISEIMDVHLIAFEAGSSFEIRNLNSSEQIVDGNGFSQWIFFVKPVQYGNHILYLKVSTIQLLNGKERKKEIVLERKVEVVGIDSAEIMIQQQNWIPTNIMYSTKNPRKKKSKKKSFVSFLSSFMSICLILIFAGYLNYQPYNNISSPNKIETNGNYSPAVISGDGVQINYGGDFQLNDVNVFEINNGDSINFSVPIGKIQRINGIKQ